MASKKDKLLESAQRFVMKGQLDRAIKDYQQIVALEPGEIRHRQKLAELLVRENRKDEAIAQYEDIGRHYADNAYYLKAIAVYKQVQRLSPGNIPVTLTIASLNHQQGLIGNALAEYGQVVAQLEKEGALGEALKVLEQMLVVDAQHAATRLKYAELLFASGDSDASCRAFTALAAALRADGDGAGARRVSDRLGELFPERREHLLDLISARMQAGELAGAVQSLQDLLKKDSGSWPAWQLLCEAQERRGNRAGVRQVYHQMVQLFPHELGALEGAVRCDLEAGDFGRAKSLLLSRLQLFIEKGVPLSAEPLLQSLSSGEGGEEVTDALRRIYEAGGAWEKLGTLNSPAAEPPGDPFELPAEDDEPASALVAPLASAAAPPAGDELPSAFGSPWPVEEPAPPATPEPASPWAGAAWEEEIELDLDDEPPEAAVPAGAGADLPEDFSLSLDFDEPDLAARIPDFSLSPEGAAFEFPAGGGVGVPAPLEPRAAEEPHGAVLVNRQDGSLYLTLPGESDIFEDFEWSEDFTAPPGRPEQSDRPEQPEQPERSAVCAAAPVERPLRGWQEIYPDPPTAGAGALDLEELESHYDLGIGYKEMGLYNEAIREFAVAAGNSQRRLDCLTLQAICYREKGEPAKALDLLRRGRDLEVLSPEERICLSYELAFLFEKTGSVEEAIGLYREVYRVDPAFHDVDRRLSALTGDEPLDVIDLEQEEYDF